MEFLDDDPLEDESIFDECGVPGAASSSATTIVEDEEPEQ